MKTFLTIALLFLLITIGQTQTIDGVPIADIEGDYATIIVEVVAANVSCSINISIGQEKPRSLKKTTPVVDAEGNAVKLTTPTQALNFMSKHGYELVESFSVGTVHFLVLRKKKS